MSLDRADRRLRVAHLTTVDLSLRFLLWPQLLEVEHLGGVSIGISSPGPWVDEIVNAGVVHVPLTSSTRGFSLTSDLRASWELWRALRRIEIDVLHTHNPKPGIYGRIVGRLAGVPVVVNTLHGFYATETDPWLKRGVVYGLEAVAARFSDAELHQNPEDLELAKRLHIVPASRGRLLGNGIDLERFDANSVDPGARERIRTEIGAVNGDIVVGTVGRLVAEKGIPEFLDAARQLGDGFVFMVAGPFDPDKPDSIDDGTIAQARRDGVRFLGMRTDMEDLYSAMDVFVLASHREGFPRAAMEAAAMGLPVIATDIRGCRQVVVDGENGFLVPVANSHRLAEAIHEVGMDPDQRQAMSRKSRQFAEERFDEREVVRIVIETYRRALEAKSLSHLALPGMVPAGEVSLDPTDARRDQAEALANLHFDLISGGFLRSLGRRFMRVLYEGLLQWRGTTALVVEDSMGPVGFVVAVDDVAAFYRWFIKRFWLKAGIAAIPRVFNPVVLWKALETFRYGAGESVPSVDAEVLSLGVAIRARRRNLSGRLLEEVTARREGEPIRVVVGAENSVAIRAYERAGFSRTTTIEVHRGEKSEVLVWRRV